MVTRRRLLAGIAGIGTVTTAGCSDVFSCGPGEDAIEDIAEQEDPGEVSVEGEVYKATDGPLYIDDTTGKAVLAPQEGMEITGGHEGACVSATGRVATSEDAETLANIHDWDVWIYVSDLAGI